MFYTINFYENYQINYESKNLIFLYDHLNFELKYNHFLNSNYFLKYNFHLNLYFKTIDSYFKIQFLKAF